MYSKLLRENGLKNFIGGMGYNFRYDKAPETFKADAQRLLKEADIRSENVYTGRQTHQTNVAYCNGEMGEPFVIGHQFPDTDGLITDRAGVVLMIKFADCTPIVFYDPVKKVQAAVHSGWRSTVGKIAHVALNKMIDDFGSSKEDILSFVGPSIDQENYEVGPEVYEAFLDHPERDTFFKPKGDKYLLDMSKANYQLLREFGLKKENIEKSSLSTFTSEKLHSARQEGKDYALNAIVTCMED